MAVGGEFNGWVPVPLACQQVINLVLEQAKSQVFSVIMLGPKFICRALPGLLILTLSLDVMPTGLTL